jgi:hypothetical protein
VRRVDLRVNKTAIFLKPIASAQHGGLLDHLLISFMARRCGWRGQKLLRNQ